MFFKEDNTYKDIRAKSLEQWLDDMEKHGDVSVRAGIPLVRSYLYSLQQENKRLLDENELKNTYLKKMSARKNSDKA